MWHNDEYFITVLSNNYSTPIKRLGFDIVKLTLSVEYSTIESPNGRINNKLIEYKGEYIIGKDKVTIQAQDSFLVASENDDLERGWRLLPNGNYIFFDSRFLENVTFVRNTEDNIVYFYWGENDDEKAIRKINGFIRDQILLKPYKHMGNLTMKTFVHKVNLSNKRRKSHA